MRIDNLRTEHTADRSRIVATVTWEDSERPVQEIYFETEREFASALTCTPHPFLTGCIVPALYFGEKRVVVDGEVCLELVRNLDTALRILRYWWYSPDHPLVQIEAKVSAARYPVPATGRSGLFFSGGVDSFSALRLNRLSYPATHPASFRDGVIVFGFELDDPLAFRHVVDYLSPAATEADLTLMPVYTNVYQDYRAEDDKNGYLFWMEYAIGAMLSSVGHALSQRLDAISISPSLYLPSLVPHGSHPLLDPLYSSSDLRIQHDNITWTRYERVLLISDWEAARNHLRVCNNYRLYQSGRLNCGRCEKCIRTMLELVATGMLAHSSSFPTRDVTPDDVRPMLEIVVPFYQELLPDLAKQGRDDLVQAIERRIAERLDQVPGFRAAVKRFDHRYLGGRLAGLFSLWPRRSVRPEPGKSS